MLQEERLEKIMIFLNKKKNVSNTELCQYLFCSQSTLRRDLLTLEKDGLVKRYHGGVALISSANTEFSYFFREVEYTKEKEYICDLARDFIGDNQALFLDPSSTSYKLCRHLENSRNLVVITNGLQHALSLSKIDHLQVYMVGGEIKQNSASVIGGLTGEFLNNFKADLAFISCRGIDLNGIYEADLNQALLKQQLIKNAKKTILLCDNSKFDSEHFFKLTTYDKIDTLITNKKPATLYQQKLEEYGCEIIY